MILNKIEKSVNESERLVVTYHKINGHIITENEFVSLFDKDIKEIVNYKKNVIIPAKHKRFKDDLENNYETKLKEEQCRQYKRYKRKYFADLKIEEWKKTYWKQRYREYDSIDIDIKYDTDWGCGMSSYTLLHTNDGKLPIDNIKRIYNEFKNTKYFKYVTGYELSVNNVSEKDEIQNSVYNIPFVKLRFYLPVNIWKEAKKKEKSSQDSITNALTDYYDSKNSGSYCGD